MDPNRLPRLAYEREFLEHRKTNNWARGIKTILDQTGFGYVWEIGHAVQFNSFIKAFKQRLRDMFIQYWASNCDSSDKFRKYRSMKLHFGFENYLNTVTIPKFRFALTRLRTPTSYLHINRRLIYKNPITKCPFCLGEESELHFLTECPTYEDLRIKYVAKHFQNLKMVTLNQLVNNDNTKILQDIAMYAYYAFSRRSTKLREIKLRKRADVRP